MHYRISQKALKLKIVKKIAKKFFRKKLKIGSGFKGFTSYSALDDGQLGPAFPAEYIFEALETSAEGSSIKSSLVLSTLLHTSF